MLILSDRDRNVKLCNADITAFAAVIYYDKEDVNYVRKFCLL